MDDTMVATQVISLQDAAEFIWFEADLLDSASYDEWLALWTEDARYVVPIDPATTDFEDALNYAYDDAAMRRKRVERMVSGQSISASPVARTIRFSSRFRLLSADRTTCEVRCAQSLTEFRRGRERTYTADVVFKLVRAPEGLRIRQKVIRLINATEGLMGVSYIL